MSILYCYRYTALKVSVPLRRLLLYPTSSEGHYIFVWVAAHSTAHTITTCVLGGPTLRIQAETEDGNARWCGEFPAKCEWQEGVDRSMRV